MADAPITILQRVRELMKRPGVRKASGRRGTSATSPGVPLDTFVELLYEHGSAYKVSQIIGVADTNVVQRRKWIEEQLGIELPRGRVECWKAQKQRSRLILHVTDAEVLMGSDLHAWPEIYGTAMAAFVDFNRRHKPAVVILNGDGMDGAAISRHARIGWEGRPPPADELEALSSYLDLVRKANPNGRYIYTRGNHERLETYLSGNAPMVEGMKGTTLADHLPGWEECISVHFNPDDDGLNPELVTKHRGRHSGIHATFNELRALGCSFCHGHLHSQKVVSYENSRGSIYGVDLGMLAPVSGPQFGYHEDSMPNWRSGLGMFTFQNGRLEVPELATVKHEERGEIRFRGQTLTYQI